MSAYPIPAQTTRTLLSVANSRFYTTVACADSAAQARQILGDVRAEMPDASHHVYAFRAGYGSSVIEGMSDDGEPSGTGGPPVLAVLRGASIGDTLIVVTRYFGGTKLGTGGLVRAYTEAAQTGLKHTPLREKITYRQLGVELPYGLYEPVKLLIQNHKGLIQDETFGIQVVIVAQFPVTMVAAFSAALREASSGRIAPVLLD